MLIQNSANALLKGKPHTMMCLLLLFSIQLLFGTRHKKSCVKIVPKLVRLPYTNRYQVLKEAPKNFGFKYVWHYTGVVLVRQGERDRVNAVRSVSDLGGLWCGDEPDGECSTARP